MKIATIVDGKELELNANDYTTKKVQILAKTDSGKSYTASKICEELLKENIPICIIDPVSAYWGLKEKFEIIIFGDKRNKHADYHLNDDKKLIDSQAELVADYLATNKQSAIVDLKYWVESKQQQFMAAFAERIYHKNAIPRHIFIEEADIFAPQTVSYPDEIHSRHHTDNLVRRGRQEGLGCTVISQRPALISKNILTQSDLSIYLNLSGAADLAPARKEIEDDADFSKEQKQEIVSRIKKLPRGEAFFYSPRWLGMKVFAKVNKKETYHAGATRGSPDWRPDAEITLKPVDLTEVVKKLTSLASTPEIVSKGTDSEAKLERMKEAHAKEIEQLNSGWEMRVRSQQNAIKQYQEFQKALRNFVGLVEGTPLKAEGEVINSEQAQITVVKKQAAKPALDESALIGRLGILAAEGFFNEGKGTKDIWEELNKRYPDTPGYDHFRKNVLYKEIAFWINRPYGYLEKSGSVYVITELGRKYLRLQEVIA